ncbi:DNA polymerase III subunit gamma/tau [Neisseriaceae bacterium ESL0693]|nr:DNA polymerase III subunit gamma/tau [Neisseriaceae bacterium ESL0693]
MTYQVLARKWRPKKFADLVGQEHVVKALVNALNKGQLHHAYLLTGTRGVGKTTIARILAKSLNCPSAVAGEPCCQCDACRQIDAGQFVDVLEIDAASNTGIDHIREVLENAQYAPTIGQYKVYIIDEVHMLSKSAFNAMLKTLEEPPAHVKFILATTDPQKVPVTVLSRCLQFVLRNLNSKQVHDHLIHVLQTEQIPFEEAALGLLGRAAAGSMRDALSLLDQAIALGSGHVTEADVRQMIGAVDKTYLYDLLNCLAQKDGHGLLAKAAEMASRAVGFDGALSELALILQRLSMIQLVKGIIAEDDPEKDHLSQLATVFSAEQLQLYYQCALRGRADLALAPDEYAGFVMTLLRMLAFAPLAAENQPLHGQIEGSQLHNAITNSAKVSPDSVKTAEPQPLSGSAPVTGQIEGSQLHNTADSAKASLDSTKTTESQPVSGSVPVTGQTEAPVQVSAKDQPSVALVEGDTIPPAAKTAEMTEVPKTRAEKKTVAAEVKEVRDEAEQPIAALPPLQADQWNVILKQLAPQLGAVQLFSQHTAIADFDQQNGTLTLALTPQGELTADKTRLERLSHILSQAYQRPIKIHTCAWHNEETPQMLFERQQKEDQQEAQQLLEADPVIRRLINTFDATWLPQSLQLKTIK